MRFQERVNRALQIADAFAVNDSHFEDASLATGIKVRHDNVLDFARLNRVEVQNAVNRQRHRLVIIKFIHNDIYNLQGDAP